MNKPLHTPSPSQIIPTLFPVLVDCARVAKKIQSRVKQLPSKEYDNPFSAALTEADLIIQSMVEGAILANFPDIPFFGEEYERSLATKYLAGTWFIDECPYLMTLDPVDGTRAYMHGGDGYQVILTVAGKQGFEEVIMLFPADETYILARKGQGVVRGSFSDMPDKAVSHRPAVTTNTVVLGIGLEALRDAVLKEELEVISYDTDCVLNPSTRTFSRLVSGELGGVIFDNPQIIDVGAFAALASELGFIVTTGEGKPLPTLVEAIDGRILCRVVFAKDREMHVRLLSISQTKQI